MECGFKAQKKLFKEVPAMRNQAQQGAVQQAAAQANAQAQPLPLRQVEVQEIVARAVDLRRRRKKESLRVPFHLSPSEIPPPSGEYATGLGTVKIFSRFDHLKGLWLVVVRLPDESFKLKDFVKEPLPLPSSQSQQGT